MFADSATCFIHVYLWETKGNGNVFVNVWRQEVNYRSVDCTWSEKGTHEQGLLSNVFKLLKFFICFTFCVIYYKKPITKKYEGTYSVLICSAFTTSYCK